MDKIEELNERLKEVTDCFTTWKKAGISEEILITWFQVKMKVSRKAAEKMVNCYAEFYEEFLKKEICDGLEDR